jgi:hypothetical protein
MTHAPNPPQTYSWEEIPAMRRHIYFYLLLVLGSIVADSLGNSLASQSRLAFAPAPPPRITSKEVYPAPVPALSPKPSEPLQ